MQIEQQRIEQQRQEIPMDKASTKRIICPDCEGGEDGRLNRRELLRSAATATAATIAGGLGIFPMPKATAQPNPKSAAETLIKTLYGSLTDTQKKEVCFPWDYKDTRGLLRTHVSNNWQITRPQIRSDFYPKEQQILLHDIFKGIVNPDWYARFLKQQRDDTGGA